MRSVLLASLCILAILPGQALPEEATGITPRMFMAEAIERAIGPDKDAVTQEEDAQGQPVILVNRKSMPYQITLRGCKAQQYCKQAEFTARWPASKAVTLNVVNEHNLLKGRYGRMQLDKQQRPVLQAYFPLYPMMGPDDISTLLWHWHNELKDANWVVTTILPKE
ncbi:YbjN domain-containing protein [Chitinilyticum piscinae]|uniref:Uncharacterized protein n=1 Tax=Chitinilyticum piscinae TaxID=2866724 RepID=A0A8J7FT63_9NEIS|nr:YbjN domain-containing protein [Chitinilyticum piscinae]MBE9610071.1 hypothetical protein [Chitinilyticum piscinae]